MNSHVSYYYGFNLLNKPTNEQQIVRQLVTYSLSYLQILTDHCV
jgi:hypothetical protein